MAKGSKIRGVIYEESTWGVAPTTPEGIQLSVAEIGVALNRTSNMSRVLRNDRNGTEGSLGWRNVAGPIVTQPNSRELPFIMKHVMGAWAVVGAGPYTHTLKVSDLPPGLTLDKNFTDMSGVGCVERYTGLRINECQFGASHDGLFEMTLNTIGCDEVDDSALLDAAPHLYPIQPFAMPKLTITEGGSPMKIGKNYQVTIKNNLDNTVGQTAGNGGVLSDLPEGYVGIEFSFDALFKSYTLLNKAKNETISSLSLLFASQTAGHSAQFAMNEVHYDVSEPIAKGPGGIVVPMKGYAFYLADAAASALVFTGINDVTALDSFPA